MSVGNIVGVIVIGLIVGALGRLVVPGRTYLGLIGTVLVGIGGALIAALATAYLVDPKEDWVNLLLAVLGAAALVSVFGRKPR